MKCFKKEGYEVRVKLYPIVQRILINYRFIWIQMCVEDYIEVDKNLFIEGDGFTISNFIIKKTNEQLLMIKMASLKNKNNNCKIKDLLEALRYNEELKSSFCVNRTPRDLKR